MMIRLTSALLIMVLASPGAAASTARSKLVLTLAYGEHPFPPAKVRTLSCDPPGGTHPFAGKACRDLDRADGDFTRLPGWPEIPGCTRDYRPVTVTARGYWKHRPVNFQHTYGNDCVRKLESGPVFRL